MAPVNRVVVITGASAGVGRTVAWEFAKRGYRIALLARGIERLAAASREVEELGGEALAIRCDVADASAVEAAAERVERELGPIDIWINNAMISVFAEFWNNRPDEYRRVTDVSYHGYVHGTLAALRYMRPRNRGVIVQVGSALAYRGIPLQSAYCGAKHAIQGFTDSLRSELMHENSAIRVTMVQLPALNTPQFLWSRAKLPRKPQPVPPIFEPEVAARAIYWSALHPKRREPTVTLKVAVALHGNKLFPGIGDWYLARTGYEGQQYDGGLEPDRPCNLWEPPPGDFGAHGPFGDRARGRSPYWFLSAHRKAIAGGVVLAGLAGALAARVRPD